MYCLRVNVYCHRVSTQLQLANISYINKEVTTNIKNICANDHAPCLN
jgi:hypothetical protein